MSNLLYMTPIKAGPSFLNTKSIQFASASSQYINFGNNINDDRTTAFSWTGYANITTLSGSPTIFGKLGPNPYPGYLLGLGGSNNLLWNLTHTYPSNILLVGTPTNSITAATWFFWAVTMDGTGTAAGTRIYINGVSQTLTVTINNLTLGATTTNPLYFGADAGNGSPGPEDYLNGYLAQIAHWNTTLTSGNITTLYNSGTAVNPTTQSFGANCDHYWPLGNPNDSIAANGILDRVGSINGSPVNTPVISSSHPT